MDAEDARQVLGLTLGLAAGIALVSLVTGDRPSPGVVVGIILGSLVLLALSRIDGALEERTARVGAVVVSAGLVGAALWPLR